MIQWKICLTVWMQIHEKKTKPYSRIHVWYIYLHGVDVCGKCRSIHHSTKASSVNIPVHWHGSWILWKINGYVVLGSQKLRPGCLRFATWTWMKEVLPAELGPMIEEELWNACITSWKCLKTHVITALNPIFDWLSWHSMQFLIRRFCAEKKGNKPDMKMN